ncbi:Putative universal stress protein [Rubrobacter xylanophilus DSM 9941]|uniref:universal stress protein n=1 Tax=Rubrobacter xylanophilus TaxID=49319 RepID=UPI001C6440E0|nr:universal stress protein [Rubrobacter xylanophilus]QYJ16394.1 Putative universal stress protein [Rubrobacter xylanophilus DSM 9941]
MFPTKILLATDGSEHARRAARAAVELAQKTGSELHVVHVGPALPSVFAYTELDPARVEEEARGMLEEEVRRIRESGGAVAEGHLRLGDPAENVVSLAEELGAGLIVVGSRGLGGLRRALMGSVSESVVRHAHCPVLVVRGDGEGMEGEGDR